MDIACPCAPPPAPASPRTSRGQCIGLRYLRSSKNTCKTTGRTATSDARHDNPCRHVKPLHTEHEHPFMNLTLTWGSQIKARAPSFRSAVRNDCVSEFESKKPGANNLHHRTARERQSPCRSENQIKRPSRSVKRNRQPYLFLRNGVTVVLALSSSRSRACCFMPTRKGRR